MASEAQQETCLCGNCKREIPMVNFTIHEIHCKRNISVCKICKEPFPTIDMEDHMTSEHTPVTCKCKMTMEKYALEEHERSACPLRMVTCQFCELELACNKLQDHEEYCGARTEQCEKCGSSVMTKDLIAHPTECGQVKAPKKPPRVRSWTDTDYEGAWFEPITNRETFTDNLYSRMPKHLPSRFYGKSVLTQSLKAFDGDIAQNTGGAQNRVREQPNLSRDIPGEIWESEDRPRSSDTFQSLSHPYNTVSESPFTARGKDFWTDFYSKDNLQKTTSHRKSSPNYFSDDSVPLAMYSSPTSTVLSDVRTYRESRGHLEESVNQNDVDHIEIDWEPCLHISEDIQLPCEFCEELFPEEDLILHQSACKPDVPSYDRPSHSPLDFIEKPRSSPTPVDHSHSVLIPCEFCGVLMEGEILFHHQDQCDMGLNTGRSSPQVTALLNDVSHAEEDWSSLQGPKADDDTASSNRYQGKAMKPPHPARTHRGSLHQQTEMNNSSLRRSSLEEMRKKNMEENSKLVRSQRNDIHRPAVYSGASNRDNRIRGKPKKKINVGTDVDKEE